MIQDIKPHVYHVEYDTKIPEKTDRILIYHGTDVLAKISDEGVTFPEARTVIADWKNYREQCQYLFQIDEESYFLLEEGDFQIPAGYEFYEPRKLEAHDSMEKVFAGALGSQLNRWYQVQKYCSRCGSELIKNKIERAMECPECGQLIYPTISPSVIVAITDGNRLLMTKYAKGNFKKFALVAGYVEAGESLEQTVRREVLEEVGLKVKNITYYKSQPWPFTSTLLAGFFAELDGSDEIHLQESELSEAVWFEREDVPINPSKLSLTNEMVEAFHRGR